MLVSVQRTSPASTRCSAHHSASRGEGAPAERAARVTRTIDRDVEVEYARAGRHAVSLSGAIRAVRTMA